MIDLTLYKLKNSLKGFVSSKGLELCENSVTVLMKESTICKVENLCVTWTVLTSSDNHVCFYTVTESVCSSWHGKLSDRPAKHKLNVKLVYFSF